VNQDDVVNQTEVESQLSAMFDGELPAAECELLSRRVDRDDNLRIRWSRYALIGAAMRFEPVATARRNFAARVSTALDLAEGRAGRGRPGSPARPRRKLMWQAVLAATMVGAVAGLSIIMLRDNVTLGTPAGTVAALSAPATAVPSAAPAVPAVPAAPAAPGLGAAREPWSYITPQDDAGAHTPLRTDLVDYIVAHSEYSTPLMRPDLLSALISGEDRSDGPSSAAGEVGASTAASAPAR